MLSRDQSYAVEEISKAINTIMIMIWTQLPECSPVAHRETSNH